MYRTRTKQNNPDGYVSLGSNLQYVNPIKPPSNGILDPSGHAIIRNPNQVIRDPSHPIKGSEQDPIMSFGTYIRGSDTPDYSSNESFVPPLNNCAYCGRRFGPPSIPLV